MKLTIALLSLLYYVGSADAADKKSAPPFFLQDPKDSLCMGGEDFRRCSIDTLFYVIGSPGKYQIHKRPTDAGDGPLSEDDDGLCLSKKTCTAPSAEQDVRILSCSHCGSKEWNILGDVETGYILTEGSDADAETGGGGGDADTAAQKLCLMRDGLKATLVPCDHENLTYTPLQLQFASESDIKALSSPVGRFMGAASDGDKKLMQSLLKDGSIQDINARDWDELTALIPAASAGHLDVVKFILQKGGDVDAADKDGITALMEASIMGHSKVVEALLAAGATVDQTAKSGVTALWLAAGEGKTAVLKLLLAAKADAGNARLDGITALTTAAVNGHAESIHLLLEHDGADPTVADGDGLTPLMNAAEKGNVECLQALVSKVTAEDKEDYLNLFSKTGFSALIIAAANGHAEAVQFLVKAGADPNAVTDDNKVTALMYAAAAGHLEVTKVLLANAADLHFLHTNGGTAFLEASTGGQPDVMEVLLEAGAKYNFLDSDGVSPLMAIASQGKLKGLKLILDRLEQDSASKEEVTNQINMASYSGGTSVMFSAAGGHLECTQLLIDLGADVNAIARATPEYLVKLQKMIDDGQVDKNDDPHVDGVTAVHVAAQGGHLDCVKLLVEAGAVVTGKDDESRTPLQLAVKGNFGEVAAELVRAGADPNTLYVDEDGEGHNLLMDAIMVENLEFAKLLIEKGADLYYVDEKKVTTILQASHRGLADIVKLLLEAHENTAGAKKKASFVNDASDDGITPLISAASEGHAEVVELLMKSCDLNAKDNDGTNALMAASARGHNQVVELLLKAGAAVNEQNSDGHTALMFAYNGKNQVETLWERYTQYSGGDDADDEETQAKTIPLIKSALANHSALVDLLLKHGADVSLKDKEGHTAKDFDFHPDADAEVLEKEAKKEKVRDSSKNEL